METNVHSKYNGFTSLEQGKQLMKLGIGIHKADMYYWVTTDGKTIGKLSNTPNIGFDSNFYYGTDNGIFLVGPYQDCLRFYQRVLIMKHYLLNLLLHYGM